MRQILKLPEPPVSNTTTDRTATRDPGIGLKDFYAERRPPRSFALGWTMFLQTVAFEKNRRVRVRVQGFEDAVAEYWPRDRSTSIGRLVDDLRPFHAWPDRLAVLYSDRHRSTFMGAFLLAALAVFLALFPGAVRLPEHGPAENICIALELATIGAILWIVRVGEKNRWHQRWIDYRLAAELVRHLRLVAPLCGQRPFLRIPAHWINYGQPAASWMSWYVRAIERALKVPSAVLDKDYLEACLKQLMDVVNTQIVYHSDSAHRSVKLERRLHRTGIVLLATTLLACALHLASGLWPDTFPPERYRPQFLTFCCGFLPALGAALAGISNQAEFRSLTTRSEAMRERLRLLQAEIAKHSEQLGLPADEQGRPHSRRALELANETADLLINEVLDWRVILLDQPLRPPA